MITTLIGIQAACLGLTSYMAYKTTKKSVKLQMVSKEKGFKYYKVGGY